MKRYIPTTLLLLILIGISYTVGRYTQPKAVINHTDTVTVTKDTVITLYKELKPSMSTLDTIHSIKLDTVHINEVVYVRDTVQTYNITEPDYDLTIEAVKLSNYDLKLHTTVPFQTQTKIITNTVEHNKKFEVGAYIGVGVQYGIIHHSLDVGPQLGVGLKINF